ncbi:MAG TPA: pilus assembly PilX N-terminal domain-containing protein [Nitrospira sp.]|nr:pilus assembly PilX N-terminal domain-containing protein [Nitrospira sp.]
MSPFNAADKQMGIALLGVMVLALVLSLVGATLLNLAWQEALGASAGRQFAIAQQLADAAGELVIGWFHRPRSSPPSIAVLLDKRFQSVEGWPSFFDQAGRSQFIGSADRPDLLLEATNSSDDQLLNDPVSGLFRSLRSLGTVRQLKIYAPGKPGLLCTVDVIVETVGPSSLPQSVSLQLGTLELPPLRAAVQAGGSLGLPLPGQESSVWTHWGRLTVGGDLVIRHADEIPLLSALATITGHRYDEVTTREDRWTDLWVGGVVEATQPQPAQGALPVLPSHVHVHQHPIPGVRLDRWNYDLLKRMAVRYGTYYAIDPSGLLYQNGIVAPGRGLSADQVFRSKSEGDQLGLIFVDTLDQSPPRSDNLGTVKLGAGYFEGLAVVQGHVTFSPSTSGNQISVLSPPAGGTGTRAPVQISGVHLNGVLYAAGNITINGTAKVYGAVVTEGTIAPAATGVSLDVWHDHDMGRGFFQGLPVVYRAPGT